MGARALFGRRVIYTDVAEINAGNIIDVLQKALFVHLQNSADIDYLSVLSWRSARALPGEGSTA